MSTSKGVVFVFLTGGQQLMQFGKSFRKAGFKRPLFLYSSSNFFNPSGGT
jgi:hypothetical protein